MTTVEEIHAEFDQAVNMSTIEYLGPEMSKDEKIAAWNHQHLGFRRSKIVKEWRVVEKEEDRVKRKNLIIRDLQMYYPYLKHITVEKFEEICKKYNLISAPIEYYTENVPEKNLREILNVKELPIQHQQNKLICKITEYSFADWRIIFNNVPIEFEIDKEYRTKSEVAAFVKREYGFEFRDTTELRYDIRHISRQGLFIAAPRSHFDLSEMPYRIGRSFFNYQVFKPKVDDPIVFRYVMGDFIQIISKWGEEGKDKSLVVPILN